MYFLIFGRFQKFAELLGPWGTFEIRKNAKVLLGEDRCLEECAI
jgi:hypothetical protein